MTLFLVHLAIFIAIYAGIFLRRISWSLDVKVMSGFVVSWSSLILSSALLSVFAALNNTALFFCVSLFVQAALSLLLTRMSGGDGPDRLSEATNKSLLRRWNECFSTWPRRIAVAVFILFACTLLFMVSRTNLQIPDTLTMKLPNSYFYWRQGHLLPAVDRSDDGRLFGTPFNGTLLWAYLIRFGQPTRLIVFFNFLVWCGLFFSVYRICRQLGISAWASFNCAALLCLSQNLLFQGSSDNDDLISSLPGAIGALFVLRWIYDRKLVDLAVGSFGIGISAGAKYFPVLYAPGIVLFGAYYLRRYWRAGRSLELLRDAGHLAVGGLLALSLVLPYAVARIVYTKSLNMTSDILAISVNKPFRFDVAYHNAVVYNLQMFVSPLTDAFLPRSGPYRSQLTEGLNKWLLAHVIPAVENYWAYLPGIKVAHPDLYDNTVWFGALAWVVGLCMLRTVLRRDQWGSPAFWLTVFFWSWNIYFCARTKYIEELGRYWILPMSLAVPLIGMMMDRVSAAPRSGRPWMFAVPFLWISTILCGFVGIGENPIRHNFRSLTERSIQAPMFSPQIKDTLATCPEVNIVGTIYGYPFFWHMHEFAGKRLTYLTGMPDEVVNIIPALDLPILFHFYEHKFLAVDLKADLGGIKFFGPSGLGIPMYVKGDAACACKASCPASNSFLLAQLTPVMPYTKPVVKVMVRLLGTPKDGIYWYRALAQVEGKSRQLADWTDKSIFYVDLRQEDEYLKLEVWKGKVPPTGESGPIYSNVMAIHPKK